MEFIEIYAEYGALGVLVILFVITYIRQGRVTESQAGALEDLRKENAKQSETLENIELMVIKLIDRWNKSDEIGDRRHSDVVKEINDMSEVLMEIKGNVSRIDGRN
jgi:hypothetical protein|tara:strand:+ start:117 stop:434 length:318 start_codon:yes stop_codon:yes gene_type:complete